MRTPSGLRIDDPSWPLLQAYISYWGITTAGGNALGTTLVCAGLANEPSYDGLPVKILSGGAAGQVRTIQVHNGNTLTVGVAFTDSAGAVQSIGAGTLFVILSALAGGGGPGPAPTEGLSYYGVVDAIPGANQFTIGSLAGLGAGKFDGATNPYYAFVLRDAGGAGAAPQGEQQAITAYVTATGVFTTAAFTAAVAVGDEILILHPDLATALIILADLAVPAADSVANVLERDVVGNKADTPLYALAATASLMRYLKANHQVKIEATGTADAGSDANTLVDAARAEAIDYWNGLTLLMISGNNAGLSRPIVDYAVGSIEVRPAFPNAIAATDVYVILSNYHEVVPTADSTENYQPRDVIGNKTDAATLDDMSALATTSLVAEVKRVLLRMAPNAFGATVNGNVDTALDDMIAHLAAYFVAAGAAWSVTVNPGGGAKTDLITTLSSIADMLAGATGIATYPAAANIGDGVSMAEALRAILTSLVAGDDFDAYTAINNVARASVNAAFQGIASVLGADGANVFNPTIQGAPRTDLDTALAQFALYFATAGAALSVTMNPGAGARANLQLILQDLGDMLAGANGIVTWPAAAAPANGVSIAEVLRQIYNDVIAIAGAGVLHEQADVPFNVNATLAEANIFDLSVANTRYVVRSLRLKCVDPGAETVTVRLYELVNNALTLVDSFAITTANFATAHSLTDMFGLFQLAGDSLKVAVIATAAGPFAVTGQYCTATATI